MTGVTLLVLASAVATFLASLTCHTLRDFSRSRLKEVCEQRENDERFGTILKEQERTLLAADSAFVAALILLVATFCHWFNLQIPDGSWLRWASQWLGALCAD